MTTYVTPGLYVWTLTLENGEVRTNLGSSLDTLIAGLPVVSAVRGPAFEEGPTPTVASLAPDTAVIGDASFTLHVHGGHFTPGCTIVFNGYAEPTTFVSPTELTTGVDMAVWTAPSLPLPVAVRTLDGRTSNDLPFTFTEAAAPEA